MISQAVYISRVPLPTPLRAVVFSTLRLVRSLVRSRETGFSDLEKGSCNHSCSGARSECWACCTMICPGCQHRHRLLGLKAPRTNHHIENCFAICTSCYLGKLSGAEHDACFTAALHSGGLSRQHQPQTCPHHEKKTENNNRVNIAVLLSSDTIALCRSCGSLSNPEDHGSQREEGDGCVPASRQASNPLCVLCCSVAQG